MDRREGLITQLEEAQQELDAAKRLTEGQEGGEDAPARKGGVASVRG
jgi:hypothetical protein